MTGGFYGFAARAPWRALGLALACVALPLRAQTITNAWQRAVAAEPTLLAARASYRAASERTDQARAALLPQVDASVNRQRNRRTFVQEIELLPDAEPPPEVAERYPSRTAQLNITQPLWRPVNWIGLAQARESERQAALQAEATEQELHTRFMTAWFDVMAARDNVLQAGEQVNATFQQWEVMRRGVALGSFSTVQSSEAEARYAQAVADRAAARSDVDAKFAALEQLTGPMPGFEPPALGAPAGFSPLEPVPLWLARIAAQSPAIRAAERALAAAQAEVRKQMAQHQPTLDLVARHAHVFQGSGSTPGQPGYRSREHSVGLQLNVPLFNGGGTEARVREAIALRDKAEADLEAARRTAAVQGRQAWSAAQAAQARAEGADHGVRAAELAVQAALTGQSTGLKTPLDELQARQQLATARRDQQRAHYDEIVALARLRAAGGVPPEELLTQVQASLVAPAAAPAVTPTVGAR
jgi:outer membrane protein